MFNNVILNVAIGLVFIYLLYSLLSTIIQEWISTKLAFRSKVLEKTIIRMLEDGNTTSDVRKLFDRFTGFGHLFGKFNHLMDNQVAAWFYAHPLIKYQGEDNYFSKPDYVSAGNFSKVMIDLLRGFGSLQPTDAQQINDSVMRGKIHHLPIDLNNDKKNPAIAALRSQLGLSSKTVYVVSPNDSVKINADTTVLLQSLWADSNADVAIFRKKLEGWYDDTMEGASNWYKRYVKYILFVLGVGIAVGFNVDSVQITQKLLHDPALRDQMMKDANAYIDKNTQLTEQLIAYKDSGASVASDTLKAAMAANTTKTNQLLDSAKTQISSEITNVNQLMGLGWKALPASGSRSEFQRFTHDRLHGFLCFKCNALDLTSIVGWLITAFAISLGAPFWFSLLNKLMNLNGAGARARANSYSAPVPVPQVSANGMTPTQNFDNAQNADEAVG